MTDGSQEAGNVDPDMALQDAVVNAHRSSARSATRGTAHEPRHLTLGAIFERTVRRWPERLALEAPDAAYTYAELDRAVKSLAGRLRAHGVGRGDRVAIRLRSGHAELYVAILAVLTCGAAYVPIDADDPEDRVKDMITRSGACALLQAGGKLAPTEVAAQGQRGAAQPDDDAWIIFTSGSTGRPKAVAVTHRSAAAFVQSEAKLWRIDPSDRVLAGLSVGFDASCEEMWLAWGHGAALLPAPREVVRAGVELGDWLVAGRITVVSTVPTLAALWDESCLQDVRLLILGGEACPEKLGWRLAAGREVWNTYGPTEATVVSTAARILPGEPITIGWPLDGWQVAVLDGDRLAEPGQAGELVISGVGLARYLDTELDARRYAGVEVLGWRRAYRTGDIVRLGPSGLEFIGRRDDQVKIGGRRIELGEVESALSAAPGVSAAAVAVRHSDSGNKLLVGYVVGETDHDQIRQYLALHLPAGLLPTLVTLSELPMSGAGKVDRRALPWPVADGRTVPTAGAQVETSTLSDHERWVAEQWTAQLGPVPIGALTDFFAAGGTSLAAAKLVSTLRRRYPCVAVADLYHHPTLGGFATRLSQLEPAKPNDQSAQSTAGISIRLIQLMLHLSLVLIDAPAWMAGVLAFDRWYHVGPQLGWPWIIGGWLLLSNIGTHALLSAVASRLLLKGVKPGRYPRNSWMSFRITFVEQLAQRARLDGLTGTPWAARYARLAGHEVGRGARLGTLPPASSLVRIGPNATLEGDIDMLGWHVEGGELVIGEVLIGAGARVGTRALLLPGARIEPGAEVEPGTVITGRVPAGERWAGAPGRRVGLAGEHWPRTPAPQRTGGVRFWHGMYALGLAIQTALPLLAALPGLILLLLVERNPGHSVALMRELLWLAPVFALLFTLTLAVLVALLVRLLGRLIEPGWHHGHGRTPWSLWMTDRLLAQSRFALFPLYASSFTNRWLRMCAVPVGSRAEVSNVVGLNRLTRLGAASFAADDVVFACARARDGWLNVEPIEVGERTFLGNSALLLPGTKIGDGSLIGVMTVAPHSCGAATSWLGAPALELPRRPVCVDPARTVDPPLRLRAARRVVDVVRILLPGTVAFALGAAAYGAAEDVHRNFGIVWMALAVPLILVAMGVCAVLFTALVKWTLMGRYRPGEHPFFSWYVWRDEIVNTCQEQLAGPMLMAPLVGTILMSWYLRLLGAKVGRDVWVENLNTTEFDLASFGDGAAVGRGAVVETHLFHDRLMSTGPVHMGAQATLGPSSVTLPDTVIGDGTVVGGRSIVMRGEELPAASRWHGAPVTPL
ncbi:MAG: Pls/PosA family non-ribosomal peptide synthetase [Solirubrobacteraceae bacterium]